MNTLPEHGFVLHTQSFRDNPGKSNKKQPDGLPLPKISRTDNSVRRHSIYREMNLDKFRSYVNSIRNYPTVKVPYHGLYRPEDQANAALDGAEVARLPQPGRRYGTFYSSVSSVGAVFTRYWPAVLGVSVGTIFLVTALVTSILCRQRRMLIQRVRWSDSPQHVTEPPDTSEYTSSSEASLASDLTRSSIHLM
ncbi:unnamed protein product [Candidula unifasciata]|uniref:Uncharacterized protein n=1 Tax=Candidula unifasciata TaxID=100452 RepID=A0A8S3ZSQ5_9EUPU|nr:unnamed protein product [Candidula unifasciata]